MKDIEKPVANPNASKDARPLLVAAATTIGDAAFERSDG